jgi:hypothetical protein
MRTKLTAFCFIMAILPLFCSDLHVEYVSKIPKNVLEITIDDCVRTLIQIGNVKFDNVNKALEYIKEMSKKQYNAGIHIEFSSNRFHSKEMELERKIVKFIEKHKIDLYCSLPDNGRIRIIRKIVKEDKNKKQSNELPKKLLTVKVKSSISCSIKLAGDRTFDNVNNVIEYLGKINKTRYEHGIYVGFTHKFLYEVEKDAFQKIKEFARKHSVDFYYIVITNTIKTRPYRKIPKRCSNTTSREVKQI